MKRDKLKVIKPSSDIFGLLIIIFTLLIHIFATMGDVNFFSGFSIFFYIVGSSLYLFGREITKQIAFPLCFLLFMFPIPGNFFNIAGLPSKSLATAVGLKFIDFIGIPYLQEGFRIKLANTTLVVGAPCNGMKSLISFAALGLLFMHFAEIIIWKRLIILVVIYPLAILLNGCRLAILVYIANNYGIEKASPESYLHDLSGLVVFIAGFLILFICIKIWGRKESG
jgi:exosortase